MTAHNQEVVVFCHLKTTYNIALDKDNCLIKTGGPVATAIKLECTSGSLKCQRICGNKGGILQQQQNDLLFEIEEVGRWCSVSK